MDVLPDPRVQEVFFESLDGTRLQAYFLSRANSDRAMLFLHGNEGHAFQRIPHALKIVDTDTNVLLLSYRGYGRSDGSSSEAGIYQDGVAALRYLNEQLGFSEHRTFILGRSIGSAVAVEITQNKPLAGLILVTPFTTGKDMVSHIGLGWLSWLIGDAFDSIRKISIIDIPTLFIHGDADHIIPLSLGQQLFQASPSVQKAFKIVPGGGHGDVVAVAGMRYWRWIETFLNATDAGSISSPTPLMPTRPPKSLGDVGSGRRVEEH